MKASLPLSTALILLCACGKDDIQIYRAPKENPGSEVPAAAGAPPAPASTRDRELAWDAPPTWLAQGSQGMRLASFRVPSKAGESDMSVVALPGPAGGLHANINRWRAQIGLDELPEAALSSHFKFLRTRSGEVVWVDFSGRSQDGAPSRVLGAVLQAGSKTWFFKLSGPERALGEAQGDFLSFLKSLRPR